MDFPRDKESLMRFFGFDPQGPPVRERRRVWYSTRCFEEVDVTPEQKFDEFWSNYLAGLPYKGPKEQTVTQLVGECLSKGLGIKKGTVEARRKAAIEQFSALYSSPEQVEAEVAAARAALQAELATIPG